MLIPPSYIGTEMLFRRCTKDRLNSVNRIVRFIFSSFGRLELLTLQ